MLRETFGHDQGKCHHNHGHDENIHFNMYRLIYGFALQVMEACLVNKQVSQKLRSN